MEDQLRRLRNGWAARPAMVAAFDGELGADARDDGLHRARGEHAVEGIGGGLRRAFDGLVFDGMKLSDALKGVAKTISTRLFGIAMKPVAGARAACWRKGWPMR
jgi:hypothetical protein